MRIILFFLTFSLLCFLTLADSASAHVRGKWTIKVDLNKDFPTYDDFAFFIESYVHRNLYLHKFEKPTKRFYVAVFTSVDQLDDQATVFFSVLDNKNKTRFADKMMFKRRPDKVWVYIDAAKKELPVFTYEKWISYYERTWHLQYWFAAAVFLLLVVLFWLRHKRRRKSAVSIDK